MQTASCLYNFQLYVLQNAVQLNVSSNFYDTFYTTHAQSNTQFWNFKINEGIFFMTLLNHCESPPPTHTQLDAISNLAKQFGLDWNVQFLTTLKTVDFPVCVEMENNSKILLFTDLHPAHNVLSKAWLNVQV